MHIGARLQLAGSLNDHGLHSKAVYDPGAIERDSSLADDGAVIKNFGAETSGVRHVRGMMANHSLAGAIGDSGWSEFVRQLASNCEWHGRVLIRAGRFFPSSKLCSECGFRNESMPLDIRGLSVARPAR